MEPNQAENVRWLIPETVTVAPGIDLAAPDPAHVPGQVKRQCVALTRAGARCTSPSARDGVLCTAHAGRLDSAAGGRAKAARHLEAVREREDRVAIARLGARAVIAQRALERAADLRKAFDVILDNALEGDKQQARTLLGYLQAAFPEVEEQERSTPEGQALTSMSTDQLRALAFPQAQA